MKYWTAEWLWIGENIRTWINSIDNSVKILSTDDYYIESLKVNWLITEYFFINENEIDFTKYISEYKITFLWTEEAKAYLRDNTILSELSEWVFEISKEDITWPAQVLTII